MLVRVGRSRLNSWTPEMRSEVPQPLSVTTPFLMWFGTISLVFGIVSAVLTSGGSWVGPFVLLTLFGGCGAAMLLMSGRVSVDGDGITVQRLFSRKRAHWDEIVAVEYGGGNLLFLLAPGGRLVTPGVEFWVGSSKPEVLRLMTSKLQERGVDARVSVRAIFRAGDR